MPTIRGVEPGDEERISDIWLRSVRATHSFLSEADIRSLQPLVPRELRALEVWVLQDERGDAVGFMGLDGSSLEALFIDPSFFRRGGGTLLVEHARRLKGRLKVEVNEENPQALEFYRACGFAVVGRSPQDRG